MGDLNQKFWSQFNSIFRILILFSSHIFIGHSRHFWQTLPSNNWTLSLPFDTKCSQSKHARNAKLQQSNLFFQFFYFFRASQPPSHIHDDFFHQIVWSYSRVPCCVVRCHARQGQLLLLSKRGRAKFWRRANPQSLPVCLSCFRKRAFFCPFRSLFPSHLNLPLRPVWPDWAIYWTLGNFLKSLATINLSKSSTF